MTRRRARTVLLAALVGILIAGTVAAVSVSQAVQRVNVTAYFASANGLYPGDEVRILGIPVGGISTITTESARVKVTFWFDSKYKVPADAKAVVLSPALVSARVIQLTPAYTGGPAMQNEAVIPQNHTAVPVEWDDLRDQLDKITQSLQPTEPGGVAPLGSVINTAADNLRGEGLNIRESLIKMSQAFSALGDHSGDIFATVGNLSTLVSALQSSTDVLVALNRNLADVTGLLANDPNEVGQLVDELNTAAGDVTTFLAENREALGVTGDRLASVTTAVTDSLDDIKQTLHVAPHSLANFANVYHPATGELTGTFTIPNFANPLQLICGSVQAASKLNYEQSAKLCVQYLAPILKNRQYNSLPFGSSFLMTPPIPVAGAQARPNEITYSEDRLRPDYGYRPQPPAAPTVPQGAPAGPPPGAPAANVGAPLPAQAPLTPDPAEGLPGLMVPHGGGP